MKKSRELPSATVLLLAPVFLLQLGSAVAAAPAEESIKKSVEEAEATNEEPSAASEEQDVGFAGPVLSGQESPVEAQEGEDWSLGVVTIGVGQRGSDTISSKFLEYRDIPQGAVAPLFRFQGKRGDYRYDLIGHDVTQKDQQYFGRFEGAKWRFDLDYTGVPHSFGNGGRSILIPAAESDLTEWRISDTLQETFQSQIEALPSRNYNTVLPIVQPTLDTQPASIDVKLQRNRMNVAFSLLPEGGNFDVGVTYFNERRTGARTNNGTSFGFNNVVETADPIRYVTQDFGVNANWKADWGIAFAGLHVNDFSDRYSVFEWDNPFRAFDSTSSNAYLGPYSTTAGPATGRMALPPSNEAWTVNGGTTLMFGSRTRASADVQFGQWTQNSTSFIPFTTNVAIEAPSGENATTLAAPAGALDGQIDVFALNGYVTSRITDNLRLNARYRFYQNDNQTPRLRFEEGYVRFDAVWEEIPRISVPYGWDSTYLDVYGTFDAGRVLGFELGYKLNQTSREFRETQDTTENTLRAAADIRFEGLLVRGLYEFGSRDYDAYDSIHGEEASFLDPGAPANLTILRRYDQAKRDRDRVGTQVQWTPVSGVVSVGASYFFNRDRYDDAPVPCQAASASDLAAFCPGGSQAPLGLSEAKYETFSLDADVSPTDRTTFYGFYTREDIFDYQLGRQSGGSIVFDPAANWSSTVDNTVDTIGAGAVLTLVPNRWSLDLFYRYQKVDGNNAFTAGSALRAPGTLQDISAYDDTKLNFFSVQLNYDFAEAWTLGVGGFVEDYELRDAQTGSVLNYMPGSFFLNANNGDYQAWVGWLNVTYRFTL